MVEEMKIRDGFKKTEVGIIPEDWEGKKLGDILKVKHGKTQHLVENRYGEYPILGTGGQIGRSIKALYNQPSVLIGRKGTIDKPQYVDNPFWTIDTLFYTEINKKNSVKYIYYLFNTIDWYSYNEASGVPSLNAKVIENISIKIPPLKEQKSIATVLSDMDDLIESTQKLIDKKKKIKQGTMQELLTGKKRLDGFSGEWKVKKLGEIVDFYNGKAHEQSISNYGKYIVVNSKFISTEGRVIKYSKKAYCLASTNDILMVMSDVPNGRAIAKCYYVILDNRFTVNQRICLLRSKEVNSKFLYYILNRNPYYLSFDDGVKQTNLRREDVLDCELMMPKEIKEQEEIVTIIDNIDSEIELQEEKLEKYKTIKKGMMQELLTGRIRLV